METRDHGKVRCPPSDARDVEHRADPIVDRGLLAEVDDASSGRWMERRMIDGAPTEFSLALSPSAGNDAIDAFSRALGGEAAVLLDRAMLLINELLAIGVDPPAADAGRRLSVTVYPVHGSVRIEIRDDGTGVVLGGLRKQQGAASHGWSPHLLSRVADRWGLVSGEDGAWVWFELDLPRGKG